MDNDVSTKILDYCDGLLTSSELMQKVMKKLKVGKTTVKKRIRKLKERGFIVGEKRGKEIYYDKSGLYD